MRKLKFTCLQSVLALIVFGIASTALSAELHFAKEATEINLSSTAPISVAVEEIKQPENLPEGLNIGLKAALMRMFIEGNGVSVFGEAAQKPVWSLASGEIPFLIVNGTLKRESLAYEFKFTVSSGYTGSELLNDTAYLPLNGNQTPYIANIASRVLACANRELQPPNEQVSLLFLQLFGRALTYAHQLTQTNNDEEQNLLRSKLKKVLLAAMEVNEELLRNWAFKEFAAHTFERAANKDLFIKPFIEMTFGRRLSAVRSGEQLLSTFAETATDSDLLCMLAKASARLGKKEKEERFTQMLKKADKNSVCIAELLAQKLLIRGDKKRAAALLMQQVEKNKITLRLVKLLEQTGKVERQRLARLRAQRLEQLGDKSLMVQLLASRFLKSPDETLLTAIDPALLPPQIRKRMQKKLHELELTSGWHAPEIWQANEPKFVAKTVKPNKSLKNQVKLLFAYLPQLQSAHQPIIGIHLECEGCSFFAKKTLKEAKEWFEPIVISSAKKRFNFTKMSNKDVKKLFAKPENAESFIARFDTLTVIVNGIADMKSVLESEVNTLPVSLSLFAFDPATGLRLRLHTTAQVSEKNAVKPNSKLFAFIIMLIVLLIGGLLLAFYLARVLKDPKRKAQILANRGEIMAAAQLLRESGLGKDAERLLAQYFEREGNLRNAMEHYLSAEEPMRVLELFSRITSPTFAEIDLAGEACLALRRFETARELFERSGNTLGVAKSYELEGDTERAARIRAAYFYDSGNLRSAVEELVSIGDYETAADICFEAQDYRSAAVLYVRANKFDKVERCFLRMGKRLDIAKLKQIDVDALFGGRKEED